MGKTNKSIIKKRYEVRGGRGKEGSSLCIKTVKVDQGLVLVACRKTITLGEIGVAKIKF